MELEKEGAGKRKKARVVGGKENIADAQWYAVKSFPDESKNAGNFVGSPKKKDRLSLGVNSPDALQVVPRKRTNANHLITPKKPSTRIPLNDLVQPRDAAPSPRKPPQKVLLNDIARKAGNGPQPQSPEKRVQRRKSLRKSTRRLTRGDLPEQPALASFEESIPMPEVGPVAVVEPVIEEPKTTTSDKAVLATGQADPTAVYTPFEAPANDDDAKNDDKIPSEVIPEEPLQIQNNEESVEGNEESSEEHTTSPTPESGLVAEDNQPATIERKHPMEDPILEPQPAALESLEPVAASGHSSPIKTSSTPKAKRRASSQRRGIRRSTRTTRSDSVQPEDLVPTGAQTTDIPLEIEALESSLPAPQGTVEDITIEKSATLPSSGRATSPLSRDSERGEERGANEDVVIAFDVQGVEGPFDTMETENDIAEEKPAKALASESTSQEPTDFPASEDTTKLPKDVSDAVLDNSVSNILHEDESSIEEIATGPLQQIETNNDDCIALPGDEVLAHSSPAILSSTPIASLSQSEPKSDDATDEGLEDLEPISVSITAENLLDNTVTELEELPESSTPNPSTTELVEAISEHAPSTTYDHDDTDMLRNFLTRVKANKEAKAKSIPKRKRSLPHSPIQLPLGQADTNLSPSSPKDEFDVSLPAPSPTKRRKRNEPAEDGDVTEPKSIRRSGRTRLPIKAPTAAPSFIPVRRLGQDGDNTITLRRSEEKELAALTRVNTRKNKGTAVSPTEVLAKKAEEKDDPAARQKALKEIFDEKAKKGKKGKKGKKAKSVVWAEELAQFSDGKKVIDNKVIDKEPEREKEKEQEKPVPTEEKNSAVKVGIRSSRISLGTPVNGTPAPKRRVKGRS